MLDYYDIKDWISSLYTIGPKTYKKIIESSDITSFYFNYKNFNFLSDKQLNEIANSQNNKYLELLHKNKSLYNTKIINYIDNNFPTEFKNIYDSPKSVFVRGEDINNSKPKIAIIGSRNPSKYGMETAYKLSYTLSKYCTIVSGLALGIDCQAHIGALDAGNYTIGVIGSGVDTVYPASNFKTFNRIYENGTIISEYNFGIPAKSWHFPARNRLISALSDIIIVVEALEKSGTSITVSSALEQGKDVMAVPGRLTDKNSTGCLLLIQNGAHILTSYKDVLDILNIKELPSDESNSTVKNLLSYMATPRSIDEITDYLKQDKNYCFSLILELEKNNLIKLMLPGLYISNHSI